MAVQAFIKWEWCKGRLWLVRYNHYIGISYFMCFGVASPTQKKEQNVDYCWLDIFSYGLSTQFTINELKDRSFLHVLFISSFFLRFALRASSGNIYWDTYIALIVLTYFSSFSPLFFFIKSSIPTYCTPPLLSYFMHHCKIRLHICKFCFSI